MGPDTILEIVMGAPEDDVCPMGDAMAPGHHGPTSGPSEADELLIKIKMMICKYLEKTGQLDDIKEKVKDEICNGDDKPEDKLDDKEDEDNGIQG